MYLPRRATWVQSKPLFCLWCNLLLPVSGFVSNVFIQFLVLFQMFSFAACKRFSFENLLDSFLEIFTEHNHKVCWRNYEL